MKTKKPTDEMEIRHQALFNLGFNSVLDEVER